MQKVMTWYKRFGWVKFAGATISGMSVMLMMLVIFADVFSRNFLSGSITGVLEIVQNYFMPLAVFPGLAYVYASGILPKMDLLIAKLNQNVQYAVINLLLILEFILFALVVYYTFEYALFGMHENISFSAGGTLFPIYPLFFLAPLGFLLLMIEIVFIVVVNIVNKRPVFTIEQPE